MSTFTPPLKKSLLSSAILSKKDKKVEEFIHQAVRDARVSDASLTNHTDPNTSNKRVLDAAKETMARTSIIIADRYGELMTKHFSNQLQMEVAADYAKITLPASDTHSMALLYQEAINTWLDSDKVSFQTTNLQLAGKLSLRDCFVLHFFSFLCCYRCEGDNMFVLAVTGCSTSGKTVLFENPVMRNAHSFLSEIGVGRYTVGSKSLLLYSDIALERLLKGNDSEKFKTLARTERTTCKIHSNTEEIPPVFLFVTSNQNVHRHLFPRTSQHPQQQEEEAAAPEAGPSTGRSFRGAGKQQTAFSFEKGGGPRVFSSSMDFLFGAPKARVMEPLVLAIKNRVLEAFVSSPPDGLVLPTSSKFQRIHAALGLYVRVFNLLSQHSLEDFHSVALPTYVLTGLIDHARPMHELLNNDGEEEEVEEEIEESQSMSSTSSTTNTTTTTLSSMADLLRGLIDKYFSTDPYTHSLFVSRLDSKTKSSVSTSTSTSTTSTTST